jgi:CHAT domain-containing protein/Tfp pilus assembly protein PilF
MNEKYSQTTFSIIIGVLILLPLTLFAQDANKETAEIKYMLAFKNYQNSNYDSAIYNFKEAIELYDSMDDEAGYVYSQNGLAACYLYILEYDSARSCFQKAIEKSDSSYYKGITYNNLSRIYGQEGDLVMEARYLQKALEAFIASVGEEDQLTTTTISNIGSNLHHQGKFEQAIHYYEMALAIRRRIIKDETHDSFAQSYWILGLAHGDLGLYEKELEFLNKALNIWHKLYGEQNEPVARVYSDIALCYGKLGYPDKKLVYLEKSIAIRKSIHVQPSQHLSTSYSDLGQHYYQLRDYDLALDYYRQSLNVIGIKMLQTDDFKNLVIESGEIKSKPILLNILKSIGETLLAAYNVNHNDDYLTGAENIYGRAVSIVYQQRGQLGTIEAKRALSKNVRPLFEGAIQTSLLRYQLTADETYLINAFEFSEKSKSYILQERLNESGAKKWGGVPAHLLAKEKKSGLKLSNIQRRLLKSQQENDTSKIHQLNKEFNNLKLAYDSIIKSFEREYPNYFRLKYDTKDLTVKDIRKYLLDDGKDLLEFFIGDSAIYIFKLSMNDITVNTVKKDFDLAKWVSLMRNGIYDYHFTDGERKTDSLYLRCRQMYTTYAHKLYKKLIEPVTKGEILSARVIIIPDGELSFIPFGALLTQIPNDDQSYRDFPYLIKSHSINLLYAASLYLLDVENPVEDNLRLVAFAPSFESIKPAYTSIDNKRRSGLAPLKYNRAEVAYIANVLDTDIFSGLDASLENFMHEAGKYDIIHIASHAKADNENPELSFVAFSKDIETEADPNLYLADIYNMDLDVEMVVLSACETGFGKLYGSEGVASLAQGFAYAGCKSMVTTLWGVDDKATSDIISNFYYSLSNGVDKDVALYQSQIEYLASDIKDDQLHPYYWAGIIMIGDPRPIIKDNSALKSYAILIGSILVLVAFVAFYHKNSVSK